MKVLLTGATGYIGKRLLPVLVHHGHKVVCCVRDKDRFNTSESLLSSIDIVETDLLIPETLDHIPDDIDAAYYLVHSMSTSADYHELEKTSAINFRNKIEQTRAKQVIYLSGIVNDDILSKHLTSRKNVEMELSKGNYALTTLRAGIIIGSGSASFEIIRDLVEKIPIMIAPRWLNTRCQPIAVSDVIKMLNQSLLTESTYNQSFDISGPDIMTYKEMLTGYADIRNLKRKIITLPVMTPKLSSYWLYFVTSTSYKLATALVESMKTEVVARDNRINRLLNIIPISYYESLRRSFIKIEQNEILSSWKDSFISGMSSYHISEYISVPVFGCYNDSRRMKLVDRNNSIEKIWQIGGNNGWYYADRLWRLRGFIDKLFGGVGLRRGRTNHNKIYTGDTVDFWRVLFASKKMGRLLLFAEMKLPGEAWLEFNIEDDYLVLTATFRPRGLLGRLYWYAVYPFHGIVFNGMLRKLTDQVKM